MAFPVVMYRCESWTTRRLSTKELIISNSGAGEDSWESLGQQEIKPVNSKGNQFWIIIGRADAEAETPILWPPDTKNWLTEKTLMLGMIESGRRRERQRTRWMASLMRWTWVWANSPSWWWTGKPGVLQSMGLQWVGHTERVNWTNIIPTQVFWPEEFLGLYNTWGHKESDTTEWLSYQVCSENTFYNNLVN